MASQAKQELRSSTKRKVSELSSDVVQEQSIKAQTTIQSLPQYISASRVAIYLAMSKGEAQTDLLIRQALEDGKTVFVPDIYAIGTEKPKRKVMDMLRLQTVQEYENLGRDSWSIPKLPVQGVADRRNAMGGRGRCFEPDGTETACRAPESLDVIVVPGAVFDSRMGRIGHGAGFYDSYFARLHAAEKRSAPYLVGLCLTEQLLPFGSEVVMQEWDWRMDAIASGDGRLLTLNDSQ